MMEEMKSERDKLVEHFDKDTDLKEKMIHHRRQVPYFT